MTILNRPDVIAILNETKAKLERCGIYSLVSSNVLPGADASLSLFLGESEYDVQAAYVAQGDGGALAHQDNGPFAERVAAAMAEWAIVKAAEPGEAS